MNNGFDLFIYKLVVLDCLDKLFIKIREGFTEMTLFNLLAVLRKDMHSKDNHSNPTQSLIKSGSNIT